MKPLTLRVPRSVPPPNWANRGKRTKTPTAPAKTTRTDPATSPRNCGAARRPTTISSGGAKPSVAVREARASSAPIESRQSIAAQIATTTYARTRTPKTNCTLSRQPVRTSIEARTKRCRSSLPVRRAKSFTTRSQVRKRPSAPIAPSRLPSPRNPSRLQPKIAAIARFASQSGSVRPRGPSVTYQLSIARKTPRKRSAKSSCEIAKATMPRTARRKVARRCWRRSVMGRLPPRVRARSR